MANRKLSIGCVLLVGGALTNCGGQVGTPSERTDERGQGGSGFVGVPISGGGAGTIAGATGIGFGGYVGTCCPGVGGYAPGAGAGGYVGVPPIGGQGGYVGTQQGGDGPYGGEGGAAGWGGEAGDGGGGEDGDN